MFIGILVGIMGLAAAPGGSTSTSKSMLEDGTSAFLLEDGFFLMLEA